MAETLRSDGPSAATDEPPDGDSSGPIPLTALPMIETHLSAVEAGRNRVMEQMEALVREGLGKHVRRRSVDDRLTSQNPAVLATSLQTAYNLSVLPTLVASLVADLTEAVESRIRSSFDMASLAREVGGKGACRVRWVSMPDARRRSIERVGLCLQVAVPQRAGELGRAAMDDGALDEARATGRGHGRLLHQGARPTPSAR